MGVGTTKAIVERKRRERLATAAVLLNFCSYERWLGGWVGGWVDG